MAFTQSDLEAVDRAIARGEQSVQFADRMVTYRSVADLVKAREVIRASLRTAARTVVGVGDKGL